jgi:hypothetical protein
MHICRRDCVTATPRQLQWLRTGLELALSCGAWMPPMHAEIGMGAQCRARSCWWKPAATAQTHICFVRPLGHPSLTPNPPAATRVLPPPRPPQPPSAAPFPSPSALSGRPATCWAGNTLGSTPACWERRAASQWSPSPTSSCTRCRAPTCRLCCSSGAQGVCGGMGSVGVAVAAGKAAAGRLRIGCTSARGLRARGAFQACRTVSGAGCLQSRRPSRHSGRLRHNDPTLSQASACHRV